ncbi:hypothetical protein BO71DRAFT_437113 [Aspergillus ellipticus CBS 707.79]|uniref:Mediator of RNA polymerase II transcription subunit 11 n=1 Tax=Aspergillus ellipticus CBS 707.79 TaxID=1448320 RepID=A0A319DR21_9EURO|nr:hypothetical protein BO71DRAFT_437113 [Aspergillus ellipticus CBS 707.79]
MLPPRGAGLGAPPGADIGLEVQGPGKFYGPPRKVRIGRRGCEAGMPTRGRQVESNTRGGFELLISAHRACGLARRARLTYLPARLLHTSASCTSRAGCPNAKMADAKDSRERDHTFSSADRIRQLNEIDQDVAKLIHSAGLAIQALTNARAGESPTANSLESHKARFKEATSQYFALLSSIDVRLRRQVYALEEASILAPDTASRAGDLQAAGGSAVGASNPLDVSWLNSRKDTVGKDKEAELWAVAREFVERISNPAAAGSGTKAEGEREKMEVD